MKITELEDHDKLVTKEYLELKATELRLEIQKGFNDQFKWNMGMFAGLYVVVILGYFLK
jgi:hypothetical protein